MLFGNKRALVTGAGKGIGRAVAKRLAQLGAKVVAVSRTQADLEALKQESIGIQTEVLDVSDWDRCRDIVQSLGHFDMLVNNAGAGFPAPFMEISKAHLDSIFDLNFKAAFNLSQLVARSMIDRKCGGAIVNMSSILGKTPAEGSAPYCTSKAALDMLTMVLAKELGPYQIRTNSVNPGFILTDATKAYLSTPGMMDKLVSETPLGRIGELGDTVETVLFLLSDRAAMINGVRLTVDGGWALKNNTVRPSS